MPPMLAARREALAALCRRFAVARLDEFGSAVRDGDFVHDRSDVDLLVTFPPEIVPDPATFEALRAALAALLDHDVDLLDRVEIETSRNYLRRRRILAEAEPVYAA